MRHGALDGEFLFVGGNYTNTVPPQALIGNDETNTLGTNVEGTHIIPGANFGNPGSQAVSVCWFVSSGSRSTA